MREGQERFLATLEMTVRGVRLLVRSGEVNFGFGFDDEEGVGVGVAGGAEFLAGVIEGVG